MKQVNPVSYSFTAFIEDSVHTLLLAAGTTCSAGSDVMGNIMHTVCTLGRGCHNLHIVNEICVGSVGSLFKIVNTEATAALSADTQPA